LYIVSFVSIFFNLQIYSILQSKSRLRRARNVGKITIDKKEVEKAREIEAKAREARVEARIIEKSIEANVRANAIVVATTTTTTINKKRLLKLRKQFVCIYISLIFKTTLILLSYLLLFNNS